MTADRPDPWASLGMTPDRPKKQHLPALGDGTACMHRDGQAEPGDVSLGTLPSFPKSRETNALLSINASSL